MATVLEKPAGVRRAKRRPARRDPRSEIRERQAAPGSPTLGNREEKARGCPEASPGGRYGGACSSRETGTRRGVCVHHKWLPGGQVSTPGSQKVREAKAKASLGSQSTLFLSALRDNTTPSWESCNEEPQRLGWP